MNAKTICARYKSRVSSQDTWYDLMSEAQTKYIRGVAEELSQLLDGKAKVGGFGSATVEYNGKTLQLGFVGGSNGMVYVIAPKKRRAEHSVVPHTPQSFARFLKNTVL